MIKLVGRSPDLIFGAGTPVVAALQQATRTIPIVFAGLADPVGDGLVASMTRPGHNITGFSSFDSPLAGKWLELLKEVAPSVTRVAVLYNPDTARHSLFAPVFNEAAPQSRIELANAHVRNAAEIEAAIASAAREPGGGLIVIPDVFTFVHRTQIIALAARHRLPAVYNQRFWAVGGGLISYGPDFADQFRRAAAYIDRIFKGADPAALPVQAPSTFELVFNQVTAHALGLTASLTLLARADEVIE